jgi:hypothetical protein
MEIMENKKSSNFSARVVLFSKKTLGAWNNCNILAWYSYEQNIYFDVSHLAIVNIYGGGL